MDPRPPDPHVDILRPKLVGRDLPPHRGCVRRCRFRPTPPSSSAGSSLCSPWTLRGIIFRKGFRKNGSSAPATGYSTSFVGLHLSWSHFGGFRAREAFYIEVFATFSNDLQISRVHALFFSCGPQDVTLLFTWDPHRLGSAWRRDEDTIRFPCWPPPPP